MLLINCFRLLFARIDSTLGRDDFQGATLSGAELAAKHILDKTIAILTVDSWTPRPATLDLVPKLLEEDSGPAAVFLACGLLEHMAESFYLSFNQNLGVYLGFACRIVPQMDKPGLEVSSTRLNTIFKGLKNCDKERRVLKAREIEAPKGLKLFDVESDWRCTSVTRLVDSVTGIMRIGSPYAVQSLTYDMIEVMIKSRWLLLPYNLFKLSRFLLGVGPALDSMACPSPSRRLTELLNFLHTLPNQAPQARQDIEGLVRNLGRFGDDYNASSSGEDEESTE